jgi:hypothetical protein
MSRQEKAISRAEHGSQFEPSVPVSESEKSAFNKPTPLPVADAELSRLMEIYKVAHDTQRYEGDGIWGRFNILVSLNIVLLGIVAFIYNAHAPSVKGIIATLSACGALLSLWAVYVLHRLWLWHVHWKDMLKQIEARFPPYLPRLLTDRPKVLQKNHAWYQAWLLAYTQPFMLIMLVMWLTLLIVALRVDLSAFSTSPKSSTTQTK